MTTSICIDSLNSKKAIKNDQSIIWDVPTIDKDEEILCVCVCLILFVLLKWQSCHQIPILKTIGRSNDFKIRC